MNDAGEHLADLLRSLDGQEAQRWKGALIDVLDTGDFCVFWFKKHGIPFTAADVVAMTELVMVRHEALMRLEQEGRA
jgi:hypothetical protein